MPSEKVTESVRLHLTESEHVDLMKLAAIEDRTLSDFIRCRVIRQFLYGSVRSTVSPVQWSKSAESFSDN